MSRPDVPTTAEQWHVMAWSAIALLAALGAVGIYINWRAPAAIGAMALRVRSLSLIA